MKKESINYLDLAEEQFDNLMNETLDIDRHVLGAKNKQEYNINGFQFRIEVDGFWEQSIWFNWSVYDSDNNKIYSGTEY